MTYRYYLPNLDESASDARALTSDLEQALADAMETPDKYAERAAQDSYDNRAGWEWVWPQIIAVISGDGVEHRFLVGVELEPQFYIEEKQ